LGGDTEEGEVLQRKQQTGNQKFSRRKPVLNHLPNSSGIVERREGGDFFVEKLLENR
jgi:hypothetical protein